MEKLKKSKIFAFIMLLLSFHYSCSVWRSKEPLMKEYNGLIIQNSSVYTKRCQRMQIIVSDTINNLRYILPAEIIYNRMQKKYFFVITKSGYRINDLKFTMEELRTAIVYSDSVSTDLEKKSKYYFTSLLIKSRSLKHSVWLTCRNDYVKTISETVYGYKITPRQEFKVREFDERGNLFSTYIDVID